MTEFDFDELDRSITEAMSKSGLLKNDSQAVGAPAQPVAAPSSNPSPNPVSSSVESGKLAPGPGPVANIGASPTTTTAVSPQPASVVPPTNTAVPVQSSTSASVSAPASSLKSSVEAAAVQSQTLPTNTASISVGVPSVSSAASNVQATVMNNSSVSASLPTSSSLPQNAVPQAVKGETVSVKSGLPKAAKAKRRGRFMDIVSSQPGVSKHPGKIKRSTMLAPPLNNVPSNISDSSAQRLGLTNQQSAQRFAANSAQLNPNEDVAATTNNVSSEPQSSGSRAFVRGSSVLPRNQQSNPEFADDNDSDEADDSKNEKRSYSIGGTHGRDIAPSAELVESLQKDAQDASDEIGFSQAESRANDIQSIEDASAENDEDDARIQDAPAPKKHWFMPIGGKPKPVEKAPNPPAVKASTADIERASVQPEQPLQSVEPQIENTESLSTQSTAAEPDPPHEQTIDEIESGAIYDTSEYYTEFKDDKKHKQSRHSGLKWFLVIIVFLALGALAGAGYFFLTRY